MASQINSNADMGDMACFVISVAARLLNVHPQTLRYYERAGLIQPSRSRGNIRLYSTRDIERAQQIKRLIEDLGVNLAGVEVIMKLTERMRDMEQEIEALRGELGRKRRAAPAESTRCLVCRSRIELRYRSVTPAEFVRHSWYPIAAGRVRPFYDDLDAGHPFEHRQTYRLRSPTRGDPEAEQEWLTRSFACPTTCQRQTVI
jgi:MerR family transcriptional regulator/heat shock protein HspR